MHRAGPFIWRKTPPPCRPVFLKTGEQPPSVLNRDNYHIGSGERVRFFKTDFYLFAGPVCQDVFDFSRLVF